ncbi:sentrin-specific protease 5 [Ambystoma mexicanum]|uniref:sentrin-specific protease 5 n=1 Tax=Ambystoma mexicanum TaxID=8296 RepID=UPI0037E8D78D
MKAHKKALHRKSRFLLACKKWTTGFGVLRKRCFAQRHSLQLTKKKTVNSAECMPRNHGYISRVHRVQLFHGNRASRTSLHLKKKKTIANSVVHSEPLQRERTSLKKSQRVILKDRTEGQCSEPIEKGDLSTFQGIYSENHVDTVTKQSLHSNVDNGSVCATGLPVNKSSEPPNLENTDRKILIVLNGNKRPAKGQGYVLDPQNCKTRSNIFQCCKKRSSLFMMYKKLSMITFRCRVFKSPLRARSKAIKLRKFNQIFFRKPAICLGENHSARLEPDVCNLFACLTVKSNPVQRLQRPPDMNSNISRLLSETKECIPEGFPGADSSKLKCTDGHLVEMEPKRQDGPHSQGLQNTTCGWDYEGSLGTEIDPPVVNICLSNIFAQVTDQEDLVSCHGDAEFNRILDGNKETKGDSGICVHEARPVLKEHMGCVDRSCQMEVDECTNSTFRTKLPFNDHLYCKRPQEDPSSEDGSVASEKQDGDVQSEKQDGIKNGQKISLVPDQQLTAHICGFLNEIMKKYGSLIPLSERDVLARLKDIFNEDFSNRKAFITKEIMKYRAKHTKVAMCNFRVFYNKHMLDMDDLATLDGQNWLNDQVINMYGELIMDAVPDKVHFFNSFFHRQLVTKGYNGVKRWTKKVDLFKKSLLLIPIHLEVHWSLITVNLPDRIISFYDSQGIHFKFCVENIRKYLTTEAREKNNPEFLQGWQTAVTQCIPQQKNDSDCGVFVLQYCKCLALEQPFQFSQDDMPRVRKRIYKELCECRLMD